MVPHRVVALVKAPQATFELGCAATVFRGDRYEFSVCAETPGEIPTTEGFTMLARRACGRWRVPTRSSCPAGCRSTPSRRPLSPGR